MEKRSYLSRFIDFMAPENPMLQTVVFLSIMVAILFSLPEGEMRTVAGAVVLLALRLEWLFSREDHHSGPADDDD